MRQAFPSASSQAHAAPVMLPKPAPPQDVELGLLDHIIQRANTKAPAASPRVAGAVAGAVAPVAPVAGMPPQQIARLQYGGYASGGGAAGSRAASSA